MIKKYWIIILIPILIGLGLYLKRPPEVAAPSPSATSSAPYTIEIVPIDKYPKPVPALYIPTSYPANLSADARVVISAGIASRNEILKKDPTDIPAWMQLGVYRKMVSDYSGAEVVWLYVIKLKPDYYVPYSNLADLYQYYLPDPVKAAAYQKQAKQYGQP